MTIYIAIYASAADLEALYS